MRNSVIILAVCAAGCGASQQYCDTLQRAVDAHAQTMNASSEYCYTNPDNRYCRGLVTTGRGLIEAAEVCE